MPGPSWVQAIVIALVSLLIGASAVRAQSAPPTPPDVVVLRSGAMVRGTILEVRPEERVVIGALTELPPVGRLETRLGAPASRYRLPALGRRDLKELGLVALRGK